MNEVLNIPSNQYGYWLPIYSDDENEERIVRRIVLKKFKTLIWEFKMSDFNFIRVKNFQIIKRESNPNDPLDREEFGKRTYGWKADITKGTIS